MKRRLSSWFRRGTHPDVELGKLQEQDSEQRKLHDDSGPEMSAADFFAMDAPRQGSADAEPNPITHPHLFYSRQREMAAAAQAGKRRSQGAGLPEMDMGILNAGPEESEMERRGSPTDTRRGEVEGESSTPPSSAFPSLTSSTTYKSAEGFV